MADDAQNVSKEELIESLNDALAYEYQAVLMYTSYAAMVTGIHRPLLKSFFADEIPDELGHAQLLAEKITALGGTPTTEPAAFDVAEDEEGMLRQVLEAESGAVERYVKVRRQAEAFGDYGFASDIDTLISDETKHREETEKLLRGLARR